MTIDTKKKTLLSPSIDVARELWKVALEEYQTDSIIKQRDGCEKAYRAATEAIDVLLVWHGVSIPVGKPEAHIRRAEELLKWEDLDPRIGKLNNQYSRFVHQLHGLCFYDSLDPKLVEKLFLSVKGFLDEIAKIIADD